MNKDTPIFKIHKIELFVTICEKSLFEISNFHEQNHFIPKALDQINKVMQNLTHFLHDSGRFGSKCLNLFHHSMQILVNFENGVTCIHRSLLDAMC